MSGRLGGGLWKEVRVNWNAFGHWFGWCTLPSGFSLNFKQITVIRGNVLHMLLMPLCSIHKNAIFLERQGFQKLLGTLFPSKKVPLEQSQVTHFSFVVLGEAHKIWFWFLPQVALNAFSPNLLKSLILQYDSIPFQRVWVFCVVHFQVYLNLIEVNKHAKVSSIFISGNKVRNQEHYFCLLTVSKWFFFPLPTSLRRYRSSLGRKVKKNNIIFSTLLFLSKTFFCCNTIILLSTIL